MAHKILLSTGVKLNFINQKIKKAESTMNKKAGIFLSIIIAVSVISYATADSWTPSPSCSKPYKPYQFESQWEVDSFNTAVEVYRTCIDIFVSEQNEAIQNHQSAINDAIAEWNRFVQFELN